MLFFEHRRQRLAPPHQFFSRLAKTGMLVLLLTLISLLVGMAGYAGFEGMSGVDAFANAAMILSGMGPMRIGFCTGSTWKMGGVEGKALWD